MIIKAKKGWDTHKTHRAWIKKINKDTKKTHTGWYNFDWNIIEGYTVRILKNVLIVLSKQLYLSVTSVQATKEMSIGREAQIKKGGGGCDVFEV